MRAAVLSLLLIASPALAHRGEPTRTLRLQLKDGVIEALILYHVPAGPEAQKLSAMPRGTEQLLGRRAAAQALLGLRISIDAKPIPIELGEAKARKTQAGGIESIALLRLGALPAGASLLEIDAGEPALRVALGADQGVKLELLAGLGKPARGGLSLRPRPGRPCRVRLTTAR